MNNIFSEHTSVWETLKKTQKPIVLYGMGDGADKVIDELSRLSVKPAGVMASDAFVRGQKFRGFKVKKLSDFEEQFDDFIIALCFGTQLTDVIEHIKSIAVKHTLLVPSVPVFGDNIFDRSFTEKNFSLISKAYDVFADEKSKEIYKNLLLFQFTGVLSYLFDAETPKDDAFENILKLHNKEFYVDLGACKGDTIEEFLKYTKGYEKIAALEPNPKNYLKLKDFCKDLKNTELWNMAVYKDETTLYFNKKNGRSSAKSTEGQPVRADCLDHILCGRIPTYIKADVEGEEKNALSGAVETLKKYKPKLNIAAYHRSEDIFTLPLIIKAINPDYKIHLRHHPYIPFWDTNLYCV